MVRVKKPNRYNDPGDGTITLSKNKLTAMILVSLCIGISLNDLFPFLLSSNHQLQFYLDSKRLSVENMQQVNLYGMSSQKSFNDSTDGIDHQKLEDKARELGGGALDHGSSYDYNRTIMFVHLGKAGGTTIRSSMKVQCRRLLAPDNPRKILRRVCAVPPKMSKTKVPRVGQMVQDVFHMWGFNKTLIPLVSTYLVAVRHPCERIISTYRYSHPANCLPRFQNSKGLVPWGCQVLKSKNLDMKNTVAHKLYRECFPSPGIEDFSQALGSPWVPISSSSSSANNSSSIRRLTEYQQWECRKYARGIARGTVKNQGSVPHMEYNYRYYAGKTLLAQKAKEVMTVRTEHQWDDLIDIDLLVGGDGNFFRYQGQNISHGSSSYIASPLSSEGYKKICCILVDEIELYFEILNKAVNLSPASKDESFQEVYTSCEISSWGEWAASCRRKLEEDDAAILKGLVSSSNS